MANFLDVVDVPKTITTNKYGDLNIHGLSVEGMAYLIKKHPQLFAIFDAKGDMKLDTNTIIDLGVEVLADFLASGLGCADDVEAVKRCRSMNAEDAWDIGEAIIEESFPGGASSFFVRVVEASKKAKFLKQGSSLPQKEKPEKKSQKVKAS